MKKFIITACLGLMALVVSAQVAPNRTGQVKQVPQVSADKMLQTIVSSYRGQVLLVDFWATWCGPCRYGHGVIEPLKKDRFKDVKFVYITSDTSPRDDWNGMIGNIKGDHYYLTGSQLSAIYRQIESNAFPTYLVVGRDGKILKKVIGFDEEELFDALDKAIKTR